MNANATPGAFQQKIRKTTFGTLRREMLFAGNVAAEMLWPRRCPFCDRLLQNKAFCNTCATTLSAVWHDPPRLPETEHVFREISGAASAFYYEEMVVKAVCRMKYGGRCWYARELAAYVLKKEFGYTFFVKYGILLPERNPVGLAAFSCIVPVPPHRGFGGFHAPTLMAREMSRLTGVPVLNALEKTRRTRHQTELSGIERLRNLNGAFGVRQGTGVENMRVLLVDDLITTGATVSACGEALMMAGAEEVFAVSIAAAGEQRPGQNRESR